LAHSGVANEPQKHPASDWKNEKDGQDFLPIMARDLERLSLLQFFS
jgi:hypothetical protein